MNGSLSRWAVVLVLATVWATATSSVRTSGTNSSGLSVTLTARPTRAAAGFPVEFTLAMADEHANGAFGYEVRFGDGTNRTIAVPQYCLAPPGKPEHASWRFLHRYSRAGKYRVSVLGYVNCTSTRVTTAITVTVT